MSEGREKKNHVRFEAPCEKKEAAHHRKNLGFTWFALHTHPPRLARPSITRGPRPRSPGPILVAALAATLSRWRLAAHRSPASAGDVHRQTFTVRRAARRTPLRRENARPPSRR